MREKRHSKEIADLGAGSGESSALFITGWIRADDFPIYSWIRFFLKYYEVMVERCQ